MLSCCHREPYLFFPVIIRYRCDSCPVSRMWTLRFGVVERVLKSDTRPDLRVWTFNLEVWGGDREHLRSPGNETGDKADCAETTIWSQDTQHRWSLTSTCPEGQGPHRIDTPKCHPSAKFGLLHLTNGHILYACGWWGLLNSNCSFLSVLSSLDNRVCANSFKYCIAFALIIV